MKFWDVPLPATDDGSVYTACSGEVTGVLYRGGGLKTRGLGREPQAGSGAAAPGRVRGGSPAKKISYFVVFFLRIFIGFLGHLFVSSLRCNLYCMREPTDYQMRTY